MSDGDQLTPEKIIALVQGVERRGGCIEIGPNVDGEALLVGWNSERVRRS